MPEAHHHDRLRDLTPRVDGGEWTCQVPTAHVCDGEVIGAIGAYPTCAAGYPAEVADRVADRERVARWAEENAEALAAEAAAEQAWERAANRY